MCTVSSIVLLLIIVCYGIAKCIKEITKGSVMCHYITANYLIYDRMNSLYKTIESLIPHFKIQLKQAQSRSKHAAKWLKLSS